MPFKGDWMRKSEGYTFIEIMIVIVLMGLMMAIALTAYAGVRKSSRDGTRKADLETIRSSLEMYRSDEGSYPAQASDLVTDYLQSLPKDPTTAVDYPYTRSGTNVNNYVLCASLELGSGNLTSACGSCGSRDCNYLVRNP